MLATKKVTQDVIDNSAIVPLVRPSKDMAPKPAPCILIADDHALLRQALREVLAVSFPDHNIVEASTAEEAVRVAGLQAPVVVIMDLRIPAMNGIAALRLIKQILPATRVVMFSQHEDEAYQIEAGRAGASAYLYKREIHIALVPLLTEYLR